MKQRKRLLLATAPLQQKGRKEKVKVFIYISSTLFLPTTSPVTKGKSCFLLKTGVQEKHRLTYPHGYYRTD